MSPRSTNRPPRTPIAILGPQRHQPVLAKVLAELGYGGEERIATITAGWEERESEDGELHEHLRQRSVNLRLYERSDVALREDHELRVGVRWRTERLREVQELYRVRVEHGLEAVRELARREPRPNAGDLLAAERAGALETIRALDSEHEERVRGIREEFVERWSPLERPAVVRQRREVDSLLADCEVVCVAGGHVAILLDVLRLFDCPKLVGERALVAWSAGAMALSERVVLFHDSPPQGPSSAEVLETGLGVVRGILPLPHASHRLKLGEAPRVALFAARFRPLVCVPLDEGAHLVWDGHGWRAPAGTRRFAENGALVEVGG